MRHDRQIIEAFHRVFQPTGVVTQAAVDKACKKVLGEATDQFGPSGIYIHGVINLDMGGVSFRYKRPGVSQYLELFIECQVPASPRKNKAQKGEDSPVMKVEDEDDPGCAPGLMEVRAQLLRDLSTKLTEEQFTQAGKPEVGPINSLIGEGVTPFTAAERDDLWD